MNKRLFALLSVLVIASMALASCGTPPAPATEAAPPTEAAATDAPAAGPYECTDALGCVTIAPDEPVHIAYWGVLSGADASLGEDSKRGVEIAIDDMGGKVLDHDILLTTEDGGCTPEGGATAAAKLASDTSLVGLIGSSCSDETVGGIAAITNAGLTTISPSNTRPVLTDPARGPDYAGYTRTAHSDAFQGKAVAEFAYNFLKVTKAATLHDGSAYAQALQQVFADEFVKLGGTIVAQEAVAKDATDMKPVLTTIAAAGPELLYYPVFVAVGGFVTAQIRDVAGLEDVKIIGSDGIFTADLSKAAAQIPKACTSPARTSAPSRVTTLVSLRNTRPNMAAQHSQPSTRTPMMPPIFSLRRLRRSLLWKPMGRFTSPAKLCAKPSSRQKTSKVSPARSPARPLVTVVLP